MAQANLLTDSDIVELTGYKQRAKQAQVLKDAGIEFVERADGKIKTTWYHVNHPSHLRHVIAQEEPDFSTFKA